MRVVAVAILVGLLCSACGSTDVPTDFQPEDDFGRPSHTDKAADSDGSADAGAEKKSSTPSNTAPVVTPSTPPATPAATTPEGTWVGTLASTDAVAFGGGNYCNYKTHFTDLRVVVVMTSAGAVKSADVSGNAIEETVGDCGATPQEENAHDYAYAPAAPTASGTFQASGADANLPHAQMTATVTASTAGHVALSWHRDDIGAPLDWTITADVPLEKQ